MRAQVAPPSSTLLGHFFWPHACTAVRIGRPSPQGLACIPAHLTSIAQGLALDQRARLERHLAAGEGSAKWSRFGRSSSSASQSRVPAALQLLSDPEPGLLRPFSRGISTPSSGLPHSDPQDPQGPQGTTGAQPGLCAVQFPRLLA